MSGISIEGYRPCKRCQRPVLEQLYYQTRAHCWECFIDNPIVAEARKREAVLGKIRLPTVRKRATTRTPTVQANQKTLATVMMKAARRTAKIHKDTYYVILQEERIAAGMPPLINPMPDALVRALETMAEEFKYPRPQPGDDIDAQVD